MAIQRVRVKGYSYRKGRKIIRVKPHTQRIHKRAQVVRAGTIEYMPQTHTYTKDIERDRAREALPPGKRLSRRGNIYTERRDNRSDRAGTHL